MAASGVHDPEAALLAAFGAKVVQRGAVLPVDGGGADVRVLCKTDQVWEKRCLLVACVADAEATQNWTMLPHSVQWRLPCGCVVNPYALAQLTVVRKCPHGGPAVRVTEVCLYDNQEGLFGDTCNNVWILATLHPVCEIWTKSTMHRLLSEATPEAQPHH